jgi:arylsulfatase
MSGPFRGVVNLDNRESTPDRAPFSRRVTPNMVYAVLDDVE